MKALFVLLSLVALGLAIQTPAPQQKAAIIPQQQSGRFEIVMRPGIRADTFLLDTQTGRIWVPIEYSNVKGQPTIWKFEERIDGSTDFLEWETRQEYAQPTAK